MMDFGMNGGQGNGADYGTSRLNNDARSAPENVRGARNDEDRGMQGDATNSLPPGVEEAPSMDKAAVLGAAVWLMAQSPAYKHTFIGDLTWMIMPPIELDQFKLYRTAAQPAAFIAWGKLSRDAEGRLNSNMPRLSPNDWASGENTWIVHVISPGVDGHALIGYLIKCKYFTCPIHFHQTSISGERAVVTLNNDTF